MQDNVFSESEQVAFLYGTCASLDQARTIARVLVEEKIAACVNIIPHVCSFYVWEGKVQEDEEVSVIMKTRRSLAESVIQRFKELHSYECPAIVSFDVGMGNRDYLSWIFQNTLP